MVVVLAVEPIRTTLGYGQVNTVLMALVVADLLPDRPQDVVLGRPDGLRGRLPQGTLIGLAAAIKLTPALFVVFAYLAGRKRVAWTAVISFLAFTAFGAIFQWSQTWRSGSVSPAATPGPPRRSTSATSRCSASSTG